MASISSDVWARRAGLAVGLVLALLAVLSWRIPAEGARLGADARIVVVPPGELSVEPAGRFLAARGLTPGGGAVRGRVTVRNATGTTVTARVRGLPSNRDLDQPLRVELKLGGAPLYEGSLAGLRKWTRGQRLQRREERGLVARVWLPASVPDGYEGADTDVTLELRTDG